MSYVDFEDKAVGSLLSHADINLIKRIVNRATDDTLYVEEYIQGSDGNDIGLAFNRACRAAESSSSPAKTIKLSRGSYTLSTPVELCQSQTSDLPRFIDYDLRGCSFDASGLPAAFRRTVANNTDANGTITTLVPIITGGSVSGADIGFDIGATYGCRIQDANVSSCGVGYRLIFGLNARLRNCYATTCTEKSFELNSAAGIWTGATTANSCSNATHVDGCRSFMSSYTGTQFYIEDCDSVRLIGCISEGNASQYDINYRVNNTVTKLFYVQDHHFETANSDLLCRFSPNGGIVHVNGVDRGAIQSRLIGFYGGSATYRIDNWHYTDATARTAWSAQSYDEGDRVEHNGNLWTATANVTSADEPGVSADWQDEGPDKALLGAANNMTGQSLFIYSSNSAFIDSTRWDEYPLNAVQQYFLPSNAGLKDQASNIRQMVAGSTITLDNTGASGSRDINIKSDNNVVVQTTSGQMTVDGETVQTTV